MNISRFPVRANVCLSVSLHVSFHPLELLKRSAAGASAPDSTAAAMIVSMLFYLRRCPLLPLLKTDEAAEVS